MLDTGPVGHECDVFVQQSKLPPEEKKRKQSNSLALPLLLSPSRPPSITDLKRWLRRTSSSEIMHASVLAITPNDRLRPVHYLHRKKPLVFNGRR